MSSPAFAFRASLLAFFVLAAPAGAQTGLDQARNAYNGCLGMMLKTDLKQKVPADAFEAKLAGACKEQEATFKTASIAVDLKVGIRRADAEQAANQEIVDMIDNTKTRYKDYLETNTEPR